MSYAKASSIAPNAIPVVDIGPLRDGSDPLGVAHAIHRAVTDVGFLYVGNHGIPADLIARARQAGLDFFRQPFERKKQVAVTPWHRGFLAVGGAKMHDTAKSDLKESFVWGRELSPEEAAAEQGNAVLGPNLWPACSPDLRAAVYPYFESAQTVALQLLRAFALALELPDGSFTQGSERPLSRASITYYPPQPADLGEDRFGVAPHTDFGVLTVLCQDDVGGLQVALPSGEWVSAQPIPGTLVVNVGDLLHRWSNGRFRSQPHRVVNASARERLSLVMAYDPSGETMIDPAIACGPGESLAHEAISCGDYLAWRFGKAFGHKR